MRIALFADIHSNREAFEACLAHADDSHPDMMVFLGDLVGYGADPGWVVDTVQERLSYGAIAVKGNHDIAVDVDQNEKMHAEAMKAVDWTRSQLNGDQLTFLAGLPMQAEIEASTLLVHANAWNPAKWGYIHGKAEARRSLLATECRYTFCGHVHPPALYYLGAHGLVGNFTPVPGVRIPLSQNRRWLAVVGSVGQPRDGNPAASYALFDSASRSLTYYRVAYDHETAARKILAAGLPVALAQRLREGK